MSVTTCPSCNTPAPPGAVFCDSCGYDLRSVVPAGQPTPVPPEQGHVPEAGGLVCPSCQYGNVAGSGFCENCGTKLSQVQPPVFHPPSEEPLPSPVIPPQPDEIDVGLPPSPLPIPAGSYISGRLEIQDSNAFLVIPDGKQAIVIGREDPVSGVFPDIDLDPHGGHDAGVGRRHAQLIMRAGQIYVEDLDSVNGTVVNKMRLSPNQPHPLNNGDEMRLGKMVIVYHSS